MNLNYNPWKIKFSSSSSSSSSLSLSSSSSSFFFFFFFFFIFFYILVSVPSPLSQQHVKDPGPGHSAKREVAGYGKTHRHPAYVVSNKVTL